MVFHDTGQVRRKERLAIVSRMGRKARIFVREKGRTEFCLSFF